MAGHLPSFQSIVIAAATSLPLPEISHHDRSLARSYASCVVRVHTKHGIKTLSFNILAELFGFTAKKAADNIGISSRTLIRVCRSLGIRRWPYLGFRSEKNVNRIRQEAIGNLRRKLEQERESLTTTELHPDTPSLIHNASAKRLLRVKIPQRYLLPLEEAAPSKMSIVRTSSWCSSPTLSTTTTNVSDDDDERMSGSDGSTFTAKVRMPPQFTSSSFNPVTSTAPLLTPPATVHGFILDPQRPSIGNKPGIAVSTVSPCSRNTQWIAPSICTQVDTPSGQAPSLMPHLNLLVHPPILTGYKSDVPMRPMNQGSTHWQQQLHPRTMSMQDILTCSWTRNVRVL